MIALPLVLDTVTLNVRVRVSDFPSGVRSVMLKWRLGNTQSVDTASMRAVAGQDSVYSYRLPDSIWRIADTFGLEIMVRAVDAHRNQNTDSTSWYSLNRPIPHKTFSSDVAAFASSDTLWHLVSFPGLYVDRRVQTVLDSLFRESAPLSQNSDSWRLVQYQPGSQTDEGQVLWRSSDTIATGRGYWFRHFGLNDVPIDFPLQFPYPSDRAATIKLDSGWNLIGSPFLFKTPITGFTGLVNSLYQQVRGAIPGESGQWYGTIPQSTGAVIGDSLEPWRGYVVKCNTRGGCQLVLDPHASLSNVTSGLWQGTLRVSTDSAIGGEVIFGIADDASNRIDMRDAYPVPIFSSARKLVIGTSGGEKLLRDIRNDSDEVQVWQVDLSQAAGGNEIRSLDWQVNPIRQDGMVLYLRDAVEKTAVEMTSRSSYHLNNTAQCPPDRFSILFGPATKIAELLGQEASTTPLGFCLYQNYPNPFNPSTTVLYDLPRAAYVRLDIYNILGQVVTTLVDRELSAGSYSATWSGRDGQGRAVGSGIYLYRLTAGGSVGTKKMILLK